MKDTPRAIEETGFLRGVFRRPVTWDILTLVLTVLPALYLVRVYYPGRANVDIVSTARQALGREQYSDWHSPVIAAVWEFLIDLTGEIGSLLLLQIGMLFLGSWLIAVLIHRRTGRRRLSLLGVVFPLLPWSLSQIGILWKDTQMATALLLAVALLFFIRQHHRVTLLLLIPSAVLLIFATGARKNAAIALVPIAVYIAWLILRAFRRRKTEKAAEVPRTPADDLPSPGGGLPRSTARRVMELAGGSLAVLAVLGMAVVGTDTAIGEIKNVRSTGQISQIMLDDVMFSVPERELDATDAPQEFKDKVNTAREQCIEMGEIWDSYWNCYGRGIGGEKFEPIEHQDELTQVWLQTIPTHPFRYLEYRMAVFSHYFFSSDLEYWALDWNTEAETVGLGSHSRNGDFIIKSYVEGFALGTFPMFFKPWFWFAVAAISLGLTGRVRRFRAEIAMLSSSALLYILGYIPTVPANHFRYTYWPALAVTLGVILLFVAWRTSRRGKSEVRNTARRIPE